MTVAVVANSVAIHFFSVSVLSLTLIFPFYSNSTDVPSDQPSQLPSSLPSDIPSGE